MKKAPKYFIGGAICLVSALMPSCTSDDFLSSEGDGQLKFKMIVNSEVTRAEADEESLAEKCYIYISSSKGLIYKFKGLENVPSDLYLKCGSYVVEAWTGDSVSASFDKKFYRAYQPVNIERGVNNVVLNCKIANVVASINPEPIISEALQDYTVTVSNSRGSLDFTAENAATAHGYFMMPNEETTLNWTISGRKEDGSNFTKSGVIENVERAHEYVLNIKYTPQTAEIGGGIITIEVDDTELLVEDQIVLKGAPKIAGMGFDVGLPITSSAGQFDRRSVFVQCCGHFENIVVSTDSYASFGLPRKDFDFISMTDDARTQIKNAGIECEVNYDAEKDASYAKISFERTMLNKLTDGKYAINIAATDEFGKTTVGVLSFNVSDAPVSVGDTDWTDVYSYSATLHGTVERDGQTAPGLRFRKAGDATWQMVDAPIKNKGRFDLTLTGLQPGTRYEYQAVGDDYVGESHYFITETVFSIPNAGFENWSVNSKGANMPSADGTASFWDTGNHGSITLKINVTGSATSPVHSGSYSAKLESKYASVMGIGKLAAGNIFTGTYDKTSGTNGELTFGRKYDNSRPVALTGYATYIPGTVDQGSYAALPKGSTDKGQIYVALVTDPVQVKTADTSTLFNPDADYIVAYGELTFDSNFGSTSELQKFEINLNYRKKTTKPAYLVIVASASKYGDYFTGSSTSVMYLDDLKFEYK